MKKTMTCRQLGGACDLEFQAETFDEISNLSRLHGLAMFKKGDKAHLEAMQKMKDLMQKPGAMDEWYNSKKQQFETLD